MAKKLISIIDYYNSEAPFAAEFRRLLFRLLGQKSERELKSILVTSAMLSEGKSTVCSFLAITAAVHKGLKTLLIDCDLRRPNSHKHFFIPREHGIAEIMIEGFNSRDAVKKTEIEKLDVLTAGYEVDNPSSVFDPEAIGTLIDEMKFYYDLIIIDSPPLIPVSDPMLLAPKVDGVLLVVKAGVTQKEVVLRAKEIIENSNCNVLGVVLNNVNNALPYYYDYRYYGYQYDQKKTVKKPGPIKKAPAPKIYTEKKKSSVERE